MLTNTGNACAAGGFSDTVLFVRLKPSLTHLALHLVVFSIALVAVFMNELFSRQGQLLIAFMLMASFAYTVCQFVLLLRADSVREITRSNDVWHLGLRNGEQVNVKLVGHIYLGHWFLVLHFKARGVFSFPVVIAKDALSADIFRRCLVHFRLS